MAIIICESEIFMNRDEEVAKKYLESLGLGEVLFEPDGKVPPDFLIDGRIAVEVRRLNQHYVKDGKRRSLEEDSIPLWQATEKLIRDFGPPTDNRSWFIWLRLQRPLPRIRELQQLIRECLRKFLMEPVSGLISFKLAEGFEITLLESTTVQEGVFCMGGETDFDAGGFVISELVRNVSEFIKEKDKKVENYRPNYPEWWLVFIDRIDFASDGKELKKYFSKPEHWDRIILVSPLGNRAYDI
jgi:hypothetical protein